MSETLEIHRSSGGSRWVRPLVLWVLPLVVVAIGVCWYGSGGRYATIFVLPLVWLLRPPRGKPAEPIEVGEMG